MTKENYPANQERIAKQKELLLSQLEKTPIIQIACEKLEIGRTTFYRWRKDDSKFDEACYKALDKGVDLVNDLAQSKLVALIQEGNFSSIRFWLQTHHAKYANKLEIRTEKPHELSDAEKEQLQQAYKQLGILTINPESYEQGNNESNPKQSTSEEGSGNEVA